MLGPVGIGALHFRQAGQQVKFGSFNPGILELDQLRDELVLKFPGGPYQHSTGNDVGLIFYPGGTRVGIVVRHASTEDRDTVVKHLLDNNIITQEPDGTYKYKNARVQFRVIGEIVAYKQI